MCIMNHFILHDDAEVITYLESLKGGSDVDKIWLSQLFGATIENIRKNFLESDVQDLIESMTSQEIIFLKKIVEFL